MRVILFPDKQIIYTYLQIGCEIKMIVSQNGEQVILYPDNTLEQLNQYLEENNLQPIDIINDYVLFVNKEYVEWEYRCPRYYKGFNNRKEQHQAYYQDGMTAIAKALARVQCFSSVRLKKGSFTENYDILSYLQPKLST
jgi:hypothetical protein